jgi:hypothetical protein
VTRRIWSKTKFVRYETGKPKTKASATWTQHCSRSDIIPFSTKAGSLSLDLRAAYFICLIPCILKMVADLPTSGDETCATQSQAGCALENSREDEHIARSSLTNSDWDYHQIVRHRQESSNHDVSEDLCGNCYLLKLLPRRLQEMYREFQRCSPIKLPTKRSQLLIALLLTRPST